jgi:hypothetical protein
MVQQIHSLRASGVISSHAASAALSEESAFRKSAGTWCATPLEIVFLGIRLLHSELAKENHFAMLPYRFTISLPA